jgi:hypothetical protein
VLRTLSGANKKVMSTKLSKQFEFNYPLSHKVVRDCKIVIEHVGDLTISGMAYVDPSESVLSDNRYDVDIDFVKWNGNDIKPVLEVIGDMNEIGEAALRHAAYVFEKKEDSLFEQMADVVRRTTKAMYGIDLNNKAS